MADSISTGTGEVRLTLANRLGTDGAGAEAGEVPATDVRQSPVRDRDDPPTIRPVVDRSPGTPLVESILAESAAALRGRIAAAERRAGRLSAEVEAARDAVRRALEEGFVHTERATRPLQRPPTALQRLRRFGRSAGKEKRGASTATRYVGRLPVLVAVGLAALTTGAAAAGLLWTTSGENVVLDSGFEGTAKRWQPAGLQTEIAVVPGIGRAGSRALRVRTQGPADGEGPGYYEVVGIVPGEPHSFSIYVRSLNGAPGSVAVYPEIRWRAGDGSLLKASRGALASLDASWRRVFVSGVAPKATVSALLVVGEAAGTPAPTAFVLDDAQLERASGPRPYVQSTDQVGGRPWHPTDLAAALMIMAAALLALASLRGAVLVGIPLSLVFPPSFANLESHLPDITPTRALVIGCLAVAVVGGHLRAPPRWLTGLGAAYSSIVLIAFVSDPSVLTLRLALALTIGAFAPALLALAVIRDRRDVVVLVTSLVVAAAAVAVIALAEWYFDQHWVPLVPGVIFDALERANHLRARATFPHPIVLGTFLAMALPLTMTLVVCARRMRRLSLLALPLVLTVGLVLTLSRGPWFGAIAGISAFAALSGAWRRWKILAALVLVLAGLVLSPIGSPIRDSADALVRPETEQERFVLQVRVELTKRIGSDGLGNLVAASLDPGARPSFPAVIEGREIDLGDAIDNTYVRSLAQTGLLGLLLLTALLVGLLVETARGARSADATSRALASGLASAQAVLLLVGLTVGTLSFMQVGTAFWLVAGAGLALRRLAVPSEPDQVPAEAPGEDDSVV